MASRDYGMPSDLRTSVPYNGLESQMQLMDMNSNADEAEAGERERRSTKSSRKKGVLVVSQTEYLVSYASNGTGMSQSGDNESVLKRESRVNSNVEPGQLNTSMQGSKSRSQSGAERVVSVCRTGSNEKNRNVAE